MVLLRYLNLHEKYMAEFAKLSSRENVDSDKVCENAEYIQTFFIGQERYHKLVDKDKPLKFDLFTQTLEEARVIQLYCILSGYKATLAIEHYPVITLCLYIPSVEERDENLRKLEEVIMESDL